jgi:hypothetical protein
MPMQCWQWHQRNKGNDTILTTAKCLHINDGDSAIVTRATTPA